MAAPDRLQTLPEIEAAIWRELGRAAGDKLHEWRVPVLATADAGVPDARTVILREVDIEARCLVIYSDARAKKIQQLQVQSQAVLVMWSRRLSWQLRLRAEVLVHTEGLAATSRWASLQASAAAIDYLSPQAPGEPLDPAAGRGGAAQQRGHFAVLMARVQAVDWLELQGNGHRRAAFDSQGARWLVP
ncbi:MAG: pyridoxamine 5'-phosphate oxidase family protein [Pseudomonadota bacterium]|nr:pyridoxamine 5'-phosphate oxidase family protein [Pseudomonadota bacterium]